MWLRHVIRQVAAALRYGIAARRLSLIVVVVLGVILSLVVAASQTVAPFVLYPFA